MKDSKDFDMNQYVSDGKPTESTGDTSDAQPSKRTVLTATTEPGEPTGRERAAVETASSSSSEQAVKPRQVEQPQQTAPTQSTELAPSIHPTPPSASRLSTRQRRASLDEYRKEFMTVPKIIDRQPVFVSREVRDRIDSVVRRLGERKMSVSGFLENLARHHLDLYADDLEQWKRL